MIEAKVFYYLNISKDISLIPIDHIPDMYNFYWFDTINSVYVVRDIKTYNYVKDNISDKVFFITNSKDILSVFNTTYNCIYIDLKDFYRLLPTNDSVFGILYDVSQPQFRQFAVTHNLMTYDLDYYKSELIKLKEFSNTIACVSNDDFQSSYNDEFVEFTKLKNAYTQLYSWISSNFNVNALSAPNFYSVGKFMFLMSGNYIKNVSDNSLYSGLIEYPSIQKYYIDDCYWILPKSLSDESQDIQDLINSEVLTVDEETTSLTKFKLNKYIEFNQDNIVQQYLSVVNG